MNEYIIVNKANLNKDIEKLQNTDAKDIQLFFESGKIAALKGVLCQSVPLTQEIDLPLLAKVVSGYKQFLLSSANEVTVLKKDIPKIVEDYLNNLNI